MLHVRALFLGGGGCVWVKCPCGGSGPHFGCWVLGWCWCSRRVVWLSAAVVVVHYFALLCCTCVLRAIVCWRVSLCASAGFGLLRSVVCYAASVRRGGRGYPGTPPPPPGEPHYHHTCTFSGTEIARQNERIQWQACLAFMPIRERETDNNTVSRNKKTL